MPSTYTETRTAVLASIPSKVCQIERGSTPPHMCFHIADEYCIQVRGIIETNMEKGMQNFGEEGYRGVTETWNVVQHEVCLYVQG